MLRPFYFFFCSGGDFHKTSKLLYAMPILDVLTFRFASGSVYDGSTSDCDPSKFSQVIIRVPKDWQVDTHGLHTSLAGVKGYDSLGERDLSSTTVALTGSVSFGQVTVKH